MRKGKEGASPAKRCSEATLLVAKMLNWTPSEHREDTRCVLIDPTAEESGGNAWDHLAAALGLAPRSEVIIQHVHIDNEGNEYFGTSGDEGEIHSFDVWSEEDQEAVPLAIHFSVDIVADVREIWRVTLDQPSDIPLLTRLLSDNGSRIHVCFDQSIWEFQNLAYHQQLKNVDSKLGATLGLLEGFDSARLPTNWHVLPRIPFGSEVVRILRGWINDGQFDYMQVDFALWLLAERSRKMWLYAKETDPTLAKAFQAALTSLLKSEHSGFQGRAGHGRAVPDYLHWKSKREELRQELAWLDKEPIAGI